MPFSFLEITAPEIWHNDSHRFAGRKENRIDNGPQRLGIRILRANLDLNIDILGPKSFLPFAAIIRRRGREPFQHIVRWTVLRIKD